MGGVADQEPGDQAGHGEVPAVAQQRRYQVPGREAGVEELVGEPLDGQEGAHARIGCGGPAAVPPPGLVIADAPAGSGAEQVQFEPCHPGWLACGFLPAGCPGCGGVVQHLVDQGERVAGACVQQGPERAVVPGG